MDIYHFCLYLGFAGIACMALMGMGHSSGHGGHSAGGHTGHIGHGGAHGGAHGGHAHSGHGHAPGHSHGHSQAGQDGGMRFESLLGLLSPRVWFSMLLGFGATGVLLRHNLSIEPQRLIAALIGGIAFERLLVRPLWDLLFRFASNPARTLESAVAEEARAVTDFDGNGQGLVSIDLDGQRMQVLATLNPANRAEGAKVRTGDALFIEAIDSKRNRCTVSRLRS